MVREYTELRQLLPCRTARGVGIGGVALALAAEALELEGVAAVEASPPVDRQLLAASQAAADGGGGPLLCLRCRISHALEERLRGYHRQYGQAYGLDLLDLASYALDDQGAPRPYADLASTAVLRPFTLEVLRDYRPSRCSLTHWARQKLHCNNELKAYFRQQGLLLISDWALLADSSERRTAQAWDFFGGGSMGREQALALSRAYRALYPQAMAAYRQRSGRRSGWQPDGAFLEQLDSSRPAREVFERLQHLAVCLRRLRSGQWQRDGGLAPEEREAELADPASLVDPAEADGLAWSSAELAGLIQAALQRALDRLMPAVLQAGGRDQALLQCLWRGYGEGLSNRPLALRCGCAPGTVSKKLQLQQHASAIATAAALELRRHGAFSELMGSAEGCERLVAALRNHLLESEREGIAAPLRRWVQTFLPEGS